MLLSHFLNQFLYFIARLGQLPEIRDASILARGAKNERVSFSRAFSQRLFLSRVFAREIESGRDRSCDA